MLNSGRPQAFGSLTADLQTTLSEYALLSPDMPAPADPDAAGAPESPEKPAEAPSPVEAPSPTEAPAEAGAEEAEEVEFFMKGREATALATTADAAAAADE